MAEEKYWEKFSEAIDTMMMLNSVHVSYHQKLRCDYLGSTARLCEVLGKAPLERHLKQVTEICDAITLLCEAVHDISFFLQRTPVHEEAIELHASYYPFLKNLLTGMTSIINRWQDLQCSVNAASTKEYLDGIQDNLEKTTKMLSSNYLNTYKLLNYSAVIEDKLVRLLKEVSGNSVTMSSRSFS